MSIFTRWAHHLLLVALALGASAPSIAADTVNVYSIPENWARPMLRSSKGNRRQVNFVRFSSGALARDRRKDQSARRRAVRRPGRTFAGINEPVQAVQVAVVARLPSGSASQRAMDGDCRRSAGVHDQRQVSEENNQSADVVE
jgi:hypothetical protein